MPNILRDLADSIVADRPDSDEVYRRLVLLMIEATKDYSPAYIDRIQAREDAERGRYYWLPCCLCLRWYGGHEAEGGLWLDKNNGVSVCEGCRDRAIALSRQYPNGIAHPKEHHDEPHRR